MATVSNNVELYNQLGLTRQNDKKTEQSKQDQFMQLMIAQLQHQDPFQPQENGAFLAQLAQFDTATGIKDLQNSFESFTSSMQSNSALQASTMVGHEVLVPNNEAFLETAGVINGVVDLGTSTSDLSIEIRDAAGQLVRTLSLGMHAQGETTFSWDGQDNMGSPLPSGVYQISALANLDGTKVAQDVMTTAKVDSVTLGQGGQGMKLNLLGMGQVDFSSIREIR